MTEIEINFNGIKCKCGGHVGYAVKSRYQNRYKLICKDCKKFIRFAKKDEKDVILARIRWLCEREFLS